MSIHFRPLFTVEVTHGYYRGPCADIDFVVPPGGLAGGRLLARVRDGRLNVLYEARDDGTPLAAVAGTTLLFGLQAANPHLRHADGSRRGLRGPDVETMQARLAPGVPGRARPAVRRRQRVHRAPLQCDVRRQRRTSRRGASRNRSPIPQIDSSDWPGRRP